jgi:dihydroorotase
VPTYDLLISGGTLIDAAQGINAPRDVAFANGKVAAVAERIDPSEAAETIDATGKIVSPGLIDAHVHVFEGVSHYGIHADSTCLAHGATTVVDAGSAGADTFKGFRKYVIEASATRILAHVNISSMGMIAEDVGELDDIKWASVPKALQTIEANRDVILGVKVRLTKHSIVGENAGLKPLFLAREAADAAGLPIMVHPQDSWAESLDEVLAVMRNGDMMTHMYHGMRHGILDEHGKILESVRAARDRGVIFDVGHGAGSFNWEVCETAMAQDFPPTTISSDLHAHNVHGPVYDLVTTVSKFLLLGMPLEDALARVTAVPAKVALGNQTGLGTLAVGSEGDAVVLEMEERDFAFEDSHGITRRGFSRLAVRAVVQGGVARPQ